MAPATLDDPTSLGISALSWPKDAQLRQHLVAFRQPRILLVDEGQAPPERLDELEDWLRTPADPADLDARCRELQRRADDRAVDHPWIDDQDLLRVGPRWI